MTDEDDSAAGTGISLRWPTFAHEDAIVANQVIVSWDGDDKTGIFLTLGLVTPPAWLSAADVDAGVGHLQADHGGTLPVVVRGSFFLSRGRAEELYELLSRHLGHAQ